MEWKADRAVHELDDGSFYVVDRVCEGQWYAWFHRAPEAKAECLAKRVTLDEAKAACEAHAAQNAPG